MIELVNKVFNNKQYTLVDEYDDIIENEIVYHFSSETDDLFCIKANDKYKEITDEKTINLIKELYDLFPPEVIFNNREKKVILLLTEILNGVKGAKKLNNEEREEFYDIQIEQLKRLDIDIDFSKLKDRLMNEGNVYMCDGLSGTDTGCFHPGTNSIFINENDSFEDPVFLHETIHKATGPVQCMTLPSFFIEGGAVSIVEKVYGKKGISKIDSLITKDGFKRRVRFNFNLTDTSYYNEVCLLKQIEYAVGYSADKDVLNGTRDILDDFGGRYGKDVLRYTKHVGNQITRRPWRKCSYEKMIKAQNLILERVFNKEFPEELTMENAQEYLSRLQEMELQRARIEGDEYYKEFYEQKYRTIKQQLIEKGYELSEVEEKIPQYIPAEFYPTPLEKKIQESPISYLAERLVKPHDIARQCMSNRVASIEQEDFKTYLMRRDNLFLEYFTYKGMILEGSAIKDGERIYIDAQRYTSGEKTEENMVYYDSESDSLKFDENGETYEFEEVDVSENFIERINLEIQRLEELRKNAMQQRDSEIQNTKRNLFQKIKEWMNMKKNNRVQEEPTKDANDQR